MVSRSQAWRLEACSRQRRASARPRDERPLGTWAAAGQLGSGVGEGPSIKPELLEVAF